MVEECPGPHLNLLVVKFYVIYLASLTVSVISRNFILFGGLFTRICSRLLKFQ